MNKIASFILLCNILKTVAIGRNYEDAWYDESYDERHATLEKSESTIPKQKTACAGARDGPRGSNGQRDNGDADDLDGWQDDEATELFDSHGVPYERGWFS